jgi:hypothetical protein
MKSPFIPTTHLLPRKIRPANRRCRPGNEPANGQAAMLARTARETVHAIEPGPAVYSAQPLTDATAPPVRQNHNCADSWSCLTVCEPRQLRTRACECAGRQTASATNAFATVTRQTLRPDRRASDSSQSAVANERKETGCRFAMQRDVRTDDEARRLRSAPRSCRPKRRKEDDDPARLS